VTRGSSKSLEAALVGLGAGLAITGCEPPPSSCNLVTTTTDTPEPVAQRSTHLLFDEITDIQGCRRTSLSVAAKLPPPFSRILPAR
jgi:hypothetical protein